MTNDKRSMKLIAHNAVFTEHTDITFEDILNQLAKRLPNHSDSVYDAPSDRDSSIVISKFLAHPSNNGVGALLSSFNRGAEINTLAFDKSDENLVIDTEAAVEGKVSIQGTPSFSD